MGLINALNCNKLNLGLGVVECEQKLGELSIPILIRKGWSMTVTAFEALDADGFRELIQTGAWQPVGEATEFVNNTPEATTQEYTGGRIEVVRNGKPQYQFNYYNKSVGFHKALYSKNNGNYDFAFVDQNGTLVLASDGTNVYGLTGGMVNAPTYTPKVGDTNSLTSLQLQLTNEIEFNTQMALYSSDQAGYNFLKLPAIVSVTIVGTATTSGVTVDVNAVNNTIFGIEGLDAANFRIINVATNAVVTITGVTESTTVPGRYVLAATLVSGQSYYVQLWDATVTAPVAYNDVNGMLFQGTSASITVAALIMVFSNIFSAVFG